MAVLVIFDVPGMTKSTYEHGSDKLTGGRGPVKSPADWPVPGLISHTAAPTSNGWISIDVWESEEAFEQFGQIIMPILQEVGAPDVRPQIYPVFNHVSA